MLLTVWAVDDSPSEIASKSVNAAVGLCDKRRLLTAWLSLAAVTLCDSRLTDGIIFSNSPRLLALDVSSCPRLDRIPSFSSPSGTELSALSDDFLECLAAPTSPELSLQ